MMISDSLKVTFSQTIVLSYSIKIQLALAVYRGFDL